MSLLHSYPDDNIPTSTAIFVYNGVFDIAISVWNVFGCTLLRDVELAYAINPQSLHANLSRFYIDFSIHYLLAI